MRKDVEDLGDPKSDERNSTCHEDGEASCSFLLPAHCIFAPSRPSSLMADMNVGGAAVAKAWSISIACRELLAGADAFDGTDACLGAPLVCCAFVGSAVEDEDIPCPVRALPRSFSSPPPPKLVELLVMGSSVMRPSLWLGLVRLAPGEPGPVVAASSPVEDQVAAQSLLRAPTSERGRAVWLMEAIAAVAVCAACKSRRKFCIVAALRMPPLVVAAAQPAHGDGLCWKCLSTKSPKSAPSCSVCDAKGMPFSLLGSNRLTAKV